MAVLLRTLFAAIVLVLAYGLLEPYIERALYTMRLAAMPKPQALPVPVEGVRQRALRDTWGGARSEGRKHEGIDIFAKRGTPVVSSTEGIVTQVGTNRLGGLVVWVLGPGGQRHYYAHLDSYSDVQPGMRIEAGRVLGHVGDTGNAKGTPPHLHYGIYDTGGAINPYPLLKADPALIEAPAAAATSATAPTASGTQSAAR
jgi:peptidoglycan LD-endopeptidase LytH